MMERDYYQILEVSPDASEKEIKRAYHRLARERHPDKGKTPEEVKRLQEEFALISTAYNVLKDKAKRAEYDARLRKEKTRQLEGKAPAATSQATAAPGPPAATRAAAPSRERVAIAQRAFAKGLQLYNAGDYSRACEFFEAAIKNNDSEPVYHVKLGMALMRAHKPFSRAVRAIQRAIEMDPYNIEHRLALGDVYEMVGSTSLAIKTYQEILKWDPSNQEALNRLTQLGAAPGQSFLDKLLKKLKGLRR